MLFRSADAQRGSRKLVYDVTNRGRKFILARLSDAKPASVAATNDPKTADDAGTGLLMRRGYTIVWSGWDSEAPRAANGMAMKPLIATDNGKPIVRMIRDDIEVAGRGWTYDHRAKKVSLAADVRIVFAAQLNDILK